MMYTGYTADLKKRIVEHNSGLVKSTQNRRPLKLVYFVQGTPLEKVHLISRTHFTAKAISNQQLAFR